MILANSFCDHSGVLYAVMIVKYLITIIKTIAPIILIFMSMRELFRVVGNPDKVKQVLPSIAKKLVAALAIFLIPTIVNYSINELAQYKDDSFASCSTNANIEYIKELKEREDKERIDRLNQREQEAKEGAQKQAERDAEDDEEANGNEYHNKKHEEREKQSQNNSSGSNGSSDSGSNSNDSSNNGSGSSSSSDSTDVSYGEAETDKRARKTITVNGRTYDVYVQTDFTDVAFDGETIASAGCSAVSFTQVASGWDRDITVWDGAKLTTERTFIGIMNALDSVNIPYQDVVFYDSYENDETQIASVLQKVRDHLSQGKPVIALITKGKNGETKYCSANHFITIYGEDDQGRALLGNSGSGDYGDLEEIVRYYMPGWGKGFLLVG